jgi:hypothetical protein
VVVALHRTGEWEIAHRFCGGVRHGAHDDFDVVADELPQFGEVEHLGVEVAENAHLRWHTASMPEAGGADGGRAGRG